MNRAEQLFRADRAPGRSGTARTPARLLALACVALLGTLGSVLAAAPPQPASGAAGALREPHAVLFDPFLTDLEERTFRYFWETANPKNGLIPDRYPTASFASIAAVGFGLTAYPIGVERGYVTRAAA